MCSGLADWERRCVKRLLKNSCANLVAGATRTGICASRLAAPTLVVENRATTASKCLSRISRRTETRPVEECFEAASRTTLSIQGHAFASSHVYSGTRTATWDCGILRFSKAIAGSERMKSPSLSFRTTRMRLGADGSCKVLFRTQKGARFCRGCW